MNRINSIISALLLVFVYSMSFGQDINLEVWHDEDGSGEFDGLEAAFDLVGIDGGDLVLWLDDGDGVQNLGAPDVQIGSATNSGGGAYDWTLLVNGDYYIEYVPSGSGIYYLTDLNVNGPSAIDSDFNPMTNVTDIFNMTVPNVITDIDLGVFMAGTIETRVWSEANYDGDQDDAVDVTAGPVTLYEADGFTQATDLFGTNPVPLNGGPGLYTFDDLPPGDYIIEYDTPPTPGASVGPYFATIANLDGGTDELTDGDQDSDIPQALGPHQSRLLSVTSGNTNSNVDAGFFLPGVVEITIWHDINGDGEQDEAAGNGITGIADGTFTLFNEDIGGPAVDAYGAPALWVELVDGTYQWQNLIPGNYHVAFSQMIVSGGDDYYATKYMQGGDPTNDSDANPAMAWESPSFTVTADQVVTDVDAGFFVPATITSFVWDDANGNGEQDGAGPPPENGITGEGANFQLWDNVTTAQALDVLGNPIVSNEIGAPGEYVFELIPPGDYYIQYVIPAPSAMGTIYVPTLLDQGGDDTNDSDVDPIDVNPTYLQSLVFTIISEDEEEDVDAGFILPAKITCYVWEDVNGNGIQDEAPGNEILGGDAVPVAILFENDEVTLANDVTGIPAVLTVGVNPGEYEFLNLAPGEYIVQFMAPPSPVTTPYAITRYDNDGMLGTDANDTDTDSDADPDNMLQSYIIELESEENHERVDAGFYVPGIVGDRVFCDKNGDGIFDGIDLDEGVPGVTVTLFSTDPLVNEDPLLAADGVTPLTMVTDAMGNYQFLDVPPGISHQIRFEGPMDFEVTLPNEGGDDNFDSDAIPDILNPENGVTDPFELLSREELEEAERNDCGMYQLIRIQGTVWIDNPIDGVFSGEAGVSGVSVELLNSEIGSLPDKVFSGVGGEFVFLDVRPGTYTVTIPIINTEPGGILEGGISCPGSGGMVDDSDIDDDGEETAAGFETIEFELLSSCDPASPPIVEYIDFCFEYDCTAENPRAEPTCDLSSVNPICNLQELTGFCSRMYSVNSPAPQPGALCPGDSGPAGGSAHNISWFSFIALEGTYDLIIDPFSCVPGAGQTEQGVQIGIYTSCDFTETVYCNPDCNTDDVIISSDNLEPGQIYYIFLDGCFGSICSYNILLDGTFSIPTFGASNLCIGPDVDNVDCADPTICIDTDLNFILDDLELEIEYEWSITAVIGDNLPGDQNPMTTLPELLLNFPTVGVYDICVENAFNGCRNWENATTTGPLCRRVTVIDRGAELFEPPFEACSNIDLQTVVDLTAFDGLDPNMDGIFGWQAGNQTWSFGENTFTAEEDGCFYENTFFITELEVPATADVTEYICESDLDPGFNYNGATYVIGDFPLGDNTLLVPNQLSLTPTDEGCDSTFNLTLELLRITGGFEAPTCIDAGVLLSFIPDAFPSEWTVTYTWIGPSGPLDVNILDQLTEIASQGDGMYTIIANITTNQSDGSTITCSSEVSPGVLVNTSSLGPDAPSLVAGAVTEVCEGVNYNYTATSTTPDVTFFWSATSGNITVTGDNNENASIVWTDSGTPNINLVVENACGSNFINVPISVTPPPVAEISTISPVCIDSISTISFVGDASQIGTYVWTYDGGTVSNGSGQDGGPHEVSWPTSGTKYITMIYTDMDGCISTTALDSVIVELPITPPTVMCDENAAMANEVVFIWNDIPGASYTFEITNPTSDYTGTSLGDTTLTVMGVPDATTITMTLITETGLACNLISSLSVGCTAQNCTPADVTVIPEIDSLCENSNMLMQTVSVVTDPPQDPMNPGTIVFSGTGVDPATGVFDAAVAMVGTHQITVTYTDGTGCIATGDTTITVLPAPVSNFSISNDTICSNQTTMFTYIGSGTAGTYTWNFDGGTITNSTNGMGVGPHEVMWTTGGTKTVSVVLEDANGCTSAPFSSDVLVDELIGVPTPVCAPQLAGVGEVVFTWPNDPSVSYSLEIITDPSMYTDSILVDTMLTVTGVTMGVPITLVLTTDTGNNCGTLVSTPVVCVPGECTTPELMIAAEMAEVCEGDIPSQQQIQVTSIIPAPGVGVVVDTTYSGPGVDPVTGVFDAGVAGPGMHTIMVIYTDENDCEGMASTVINVKPKPVASFSVSVDDICITDAITFTYDGSGTPTDDSGYLWNFGDAISPIEGGASPTVFWQSDSIKTVSLSVIVDGCQSDPFTFDVNVQDEIIEPIITPCTEQDDSAVSFEWTAVPGAIEYSVEVSYGGVVQSTEIINGLMINVNGLTPLTEVTIIVTPILGSGVLCPAIPSEPAMCIALDCPDFAFANTTTDTLICLDGTEIPIALDYTVINTENNMDVVGTAIYTGTGSVQADETFDPSGLMPGVYPIQVVVEETATGCLISGIINFIVIEQPVATFTIDSDNICQDSSILVTFTGSGLGNNMPNWVVSGGTISATATPNEYEWIFTTSGVYTIDLEITNNVCIDAATQQSVTVDESESIGDVMCQSGDMGEINISWTAVSCATEYMIFIDGVETATVTTSDYLATGLAEGLHGIEVRATSNCPCEIISGTNSGNCEALGCAVQMATLSAATTEWCQDADDLSPITIDVMFTGTDGSLASPTWTGGDGSGGFDPSGLSAGEYIVSFAYQEPDCELVEDSITFTILTLPSANPMPDVPTCYTDTEGFVSFNPDGGVGPYTILLDGLPADINGEVTAVGDHEVEVIDANGCMSSVMFTLNAPDPLAFDTLDIQGDMEIILNTAGTYSIDPSIVGGVDLDSISWISSDGTVYCSGPDCFGISEQFTGNDDITVTIFYNGFCSVEATFTVVTQMVTIIDVSNIISPNGDTSNEGFVVFTNDEDIIFNSVHIYDRWGNLVQFDPGWQGPGSHTVWDGKFESKAVTPGVYIYTMEYLEGNRLKRRTGDITVIR